MQKDEALAKSNTSTIGQSGQFPQGVGSAITLSCNLKIWK